MNSTPRLILGSGSPRRSEILTSMGYDFEVIVPSVEESSNDNLGLTNLSIYNAELKARATWNLVPDNNHIVIASDTVVWLDGVSFGKPTSVEHAHEMLSKLSGKTHQVGTGVSVQTAEKNYSFCEVAHVTFKKLSLQEIIQYVKDIWVMDKAGAYSIQEESERIIEAFDGEYETIMGLPKARLNDTLKQLKL